MPEFLIFEIALLITMQARQVEFTQDVIFLEPTPQDREIVEKLQACDMKTVAANSIRKMSEEVDDLALARSRTADQDQYIKSVFRHRQKSARMQVHPC